MCELEELFQAYYLCRKRHRRSPASIAFEVNYESNLVALHDEIVRRCYHPRPSSAFIVRKPVRREILAPHFRDSIVQTYISMRLAPLFEAVFIPTTTNCRVGRGTTFGVNQLAESIRRVSRDYTADCWILKLDLKNFFMSISKERLWQRLYPFIRANYVGADADTLCYLTEVTLANNPAAGCRFLSPRSEWRKIPRRKSLFFQPDGFGLAPGNWPSQIEANFFLNDFDHWMVERYPEYGRYVDDFYIVSADVAQLRSAIPSIRERLKQDGLCLHPEKIHLQHYTKGIKFIGTVLKSGRKYVANRTVGNFYSAIHRFNRLLELGEHNEERLASAFAASMNSYLGLMRQSLTYAIRRKAMRRADRRWWHACYISGHYEKVVVKRKYKNP